MKNFIKGFLSAFTILSVIVFLVLPVLAADLRDNDANAIIYGGAYSISELNNKLQNGSGLNPGAGIYGEWQAPNGVRTFYNAIGIQENQFGQFSDGVVKKDGTVWVGGNQIASGVFSVGRRDISPSTKVNYGPIPVYWREPKYSFKSDNLSAFVYRNYDGSFGYAILKSCGNPVTNNSLKARIITPPPVSKKYTITVRKYNDSNNNKKKDSNENFLQNWEFSIKGKNINRKPRVTDKNGMISFGDLPAGTYTITEKLKSGWVSTTGITKTITVASNKTVYFGNRKIVKPPTIQKYSVTINKYNDKNGNNKKENGEEALSGWEFRITGTGVDKKGITNSSGKLIFSDLSNGTYTITETQKSDWVNVSGNPFKVIINGSDTIVTFGNRKKTQPITPNTEIIPPQVVAVNQEVTSLPKAGGETAAISFTSLGAGLYYWLRSRKVLLVAFRK